MELLISTCFFLYVREAVQSGISVSTKALESSYLEVAANTEQIAHRGTLFFNTESGASLFFPAAGHRFTLLVGVPQQ